MLFLLFSRATVDLGLPLLVDVTTGGGRAVTPSSSGCFVERFVERESGSDVCGTFSATSLFVSAGNPACGGGDSCEATWCICDQIGTFDTTGAWSEGVGGAGGFSISLDATGFAIGALTLSPTTVGGADGREGAGGGAGGAAGGGGGGGVERGGADNDGGVRINDFGEADTGDGWTLGAFLVSRFTLFFRSSCNLWESRRARLSLASLLVLFLLFSLTFVDLGLPLLFLVMTGGGGLLASSFFVCSIFARNAAGGGGGPCDAVLRLGGGAWSDGSCGFSSLLNATDCGVGVAGLLPANLVEGNAVK